MEEIQKIFRQAIQAEIEGYKLYKEAAKKAKDPEAKALFNQLAKDEIVHRKTLESEFKILTGKARDKSSSHSGARSLTELETVLAAAEQAAKVLKDVNIELSRRQASYQQELSMAARIQKNLLPRQLPKIKDLDIAAISIMARKVGGDYYDLVLNRDKGILNLVIGDVMGKGMPAALLMASVRAIWRSNIYLHYSPARVLENLNRASHRDFVKNSSFVTLFTGSYHLDKSILKYANAGHNPPFFYSSRHKVCRQLAPGGIVIGVEKKASYKSSQIKLRSGDLLLLYTDGLVGLLSKHLPQAEVKITQLISQTSRYTAKQFLQKMISNLPLNKVKEKDDVTIMVIKKN
jgi:sigma-B regulation protein RsbU (phosphoserine phosphatase)